MTDESKEKVYADRQQKYKSEKKKIFKEAQKEAVENKVIKPQEKTEK